jgi:hypothetical protein
MQQRRKRKEVDVLIQNHYFIERTVTPGTKELAFGFTKATRSRNARRTRLSEWAVFLGEQPIFPVAGVIATGRIRIAGDEETFEIRRGKVRDDFSTPLPPPI